MEAALGRMSLEEELGMFALELRFGIADPKNPNPTLEPCATTLPALVLKGPSLMESLFSSEKKLSFASIAPALDAAVGSSPRVSCVPDSFSGGIVRLIP